MEPWMVRILNFLVDNDVLGGVGMCSGMTGERPGNGRGVRVKRVLIRAWWVLVSARPGRVGADDFPPKTHGEWQMTGNCTLWAAATRDYVAQGGKSAVGMHLAPRKRRPTLLWRGCCLPPRRMGLSNRERRMRTRPAFVNCDCPRRSLHRRCWCSRGTAQ
eukprot:gene15538-biopygen11242